MVNTVPDILNERGFDWALGNWTASKVNGQTVTAFVATYASISFLVKLLYVALSKVTGLPYLGGEVVAWIDFNSVARSKGRVIKTVQECTLHYLTNEGWKAKKFTVTQDNLTVGQKAHMRYTAKAWWKIYSESKGKVPDAVLFHDWKNRVIYPDIQGYAVYDWSNAY